MPGSVKRWTGRLGFCSSSWHPSLNHRGALDTVVEQDREAALDVRARDALEEPAAVVGEGEPYVSAAGTLSLVRRRRGVSNQISGQLGAALQEVGPKARLLLLEARVVDRAMLELEAGFAIRRHS